MKPLYVSLWIDAFRDIAFIVQCYQHRLDMLERSYSGACEERLLGIFEQDVVFEEEESLDLNRKYIEQEIQRRKKGKSMLHTQPIITENVILSHDFKL